MDNNKILFHIVGISKVINDPIAAEQIVSGVIGRKVVLKRELANLYDPNAVCVLFEGKKIGYVNSSENQKFHIFEMLEKDDGIGMLAKVLELDSRYPSLTAEMEVEGDTEDDACGDGERFNTWNYTGVSFTIDDIPEWSELDMLVCSFKAFILDGGSTADDLAPLIDKYTILAEYGFSKEFYEARTKLQEYLDRHADPSIRELGMKMASVSKFIHDSKVRSQAFQKIMKTLKKKACGLGCERLLSFNLETLTKELMAFPYDLFSIHKDIEFFPSRIHYSKIPRATLLSFLSGIALHKTISSLRKKEDIHYAKPKRGRPKKKASKECPIYYRINGNKHDWIEYFRSVLEGKINENAAAVVKAGCIVGVLDPVTFNDVEKSFGHVGNRTDFTKALRALNEDNSPQVKCHVERIKEIRKEIDKI